MNIKAVIFDLDNTLYDYDAAHEAAFGVLLAYARKTLGLSETDFRAVRILSSDGKALYGEIE